jgi:aminomethyltransferase
MSDNSALLRSPLHDRHVAAGAKLVEFAGWEMPVQYEGVIGEHRAVRSAAGLFDVSHMGEFLVTGPAAEGLIQRLTPNDVSKLTPGRAHYSGLLTSEGTYIDDLLVYRLGDEEFLLVVNASNTAKDFAWLEEQLDGEVELADRSMDMPCWRSRDQRPSRSCNRSPRPIWARSATTALPTGSWPAARA